MHTHANAEEDRTPEIGPTIKLTAPWRLEQVEARPGYMLWVRFNDGTEGEVLMESFLQSTRAGVFAALRDAHLFASVRLNLGVVTWPGELDLAPDAMHAAIKESGHWILE